MIGTTAAGRSSARRKSVSCSASVSSDTSPAKVTARVMRPLPFGALDRHLGGHATALYRLHPHIQPRAYDRARLSQPLHAELPGFRVAGRGRWLDGWDRGVASRMAAGSRVPDPLPL